MSDQNAAPDPKDKKLGATLWRSLKIALILLGLLVGGIAIAINMVGDRDALPFQYEGFN